MKRAGWMASVAVLAIAAVAGAGMLAASAQPRVNRLDRSFDGVDSRIATIQPPPSPEDCARLGFNVGPTYDGRAYGGMIAAPASVTPPPAETADATSSVEEVVVTSERASKSESRSERRRRERAEERVAAVAPPPPPPPVIAPPPPLSVAPVAGSPAPYLPGPPPGTVNRDRYPDAATNRVVQVAEQPVSTFSIDVDTASYANVRRHLREGVRPPRDAVRVEELINYFEYGYAHPASRAEPFRFTTALTPSPWNEGRRLLHVGVQGYAPPPEQLPPLNLVFLVDVSGSMQGPDRLQLAKQTLDVLIAQLRPQDRVALAVYAGSAGQVLAPTPGTDKPRLRCAVQALEAGGSTAGGAGLALAYNLAQQNFRSDAVNRVILMTDGDFNVGVADNAKLEDFVAEKRKSGVYLSVYGFGGGNYNDALMQTIAQAGNGTAAYVDTLAESRKLFRDDFTASLFPIADDVKIQVEFNPARVSEYRLIGYETRLLNREDFNNDAVDAGEVGAGAAVTALYEITPAGGRQAVDPLRYGGRTAPAPAGGGELAFLKLRYKRPGAADSRLMQQPIADSVVPLDRAPESTRFAAAVAGYGQLLRGDPNLRSDFGWAEVVGLADGARGRDPDGLRTEFITLARSADSRRSLNE